MIFAPTLLDNLKDKFPATNFIGIRLINNRDANYFIRMHEGKRMKNFSMSGRKTNLFHLKMPDTMHTLQCHHLILLMMLSLML